MLDSLRSHGLQPARLLCLWNFPGKNTGVGCHFLLQGIFPNQGLNPGLLHWQVDSSPLVTWEAHSIYYISPLEKEIATYASILAWETPWTEESDSRWSHRRVRRDLATKQQQQSVSMSISTSDFIPASLPTLMSMFVPTSVSLISAFQISSSVPFFLDSTCVIR